MNSVSAAAFSEMEFGPSQDQLAGGRWLMQECASQPFSIEAAGWMVDGRGGWRFVIALGDQPDCSPAFAFACIADVMHRAVPPGTYSGAQPIALRDIVVVEALLPRRDALSSRSVGVGSA